MSSYFIILIILAVNFVYQPSKSLIELQVKTQSIEFDAHTEARTF